MDRRVAGVIYVLSALAGFALVGVTLGVIWLLTR